jgi:hypothetical protein
MGKSWKEKPGKYRHNKDFQKKQKQKHKKMPVGYPPSEFITEADSVFQDPPEYHENFA